MLYDTTTYYNLQAIQGNTTRRAWASPAGSASGSKFGPVRAVAAFFGVGGTVPYPRPGFGRPGSFYAVDLWHKQKSQATAGPASSWGRFRKRNLKHAKECSIQQRRGFACGVCRWKRRFGCSRNSAVSAARFESGFRERDGQGQHWRGPHSHGGFLKMIVCESGGHANGLTYFI